MGINHSEHGGHGERSKAINHNGHNAHNEKPWFFAVVAVHAVVKSKPSK